MSLMHGSLSVCVCVLYGLISEVVWTCACICTLVHGGQRRVFRVLSVTLQFQSETRSLTLLVGWAYYVLHGYI